ncbi:hypothetical protein DFH07DRAFT_124402 [Mycena maculata]|uniref:Uncharacterized protein n=1 Tax=Mycena maculata TaxID=230809 RepID=A0AAD7JY67_9AGAR|nr:hypothetical protein DFH07DRAFT_124402 [Mycena maculata]
MRPFDVWSTRCIQVAVPLVLGGGGGGAYYCRGPNQEQAGTVPTYMAPYVRYRRQRPSRCGSLHTVSVHRHLTR